MRLTVALLSILAAVSVAAPREVRADADPPEFREIVLEHWAAQRWTSFGKPFPAGEAAHGAEGEREGGIEAESPLPRVCPQPSADFARLGGAPGPRAVAHHPGGRTISDAAITAHAPEPRLYDTGQLAVEPTMAVSSKSKVFYVGIACEDPDGAYKLTSRQLESDDDGRSWRDVSPRLPGGSHAHGATLDPYLWLDRDTDRLFTADITTVAGCNPISFRGAQGGGWSTSSVCGLTDHQNVFAGPPARSQTRGYPNVVYYCAADAGALAGSSTATSCARSLDGGTTWTRTASPAFIAAGPRAGNSGCDGLTGPGFVDARGTVYVPRGFCGEPFLAISDDEGDSWRRVKVSDLGVAQRSDTDQEHEAAVAVDADGTIYYFWIARDRKPYLAISRDGAGRSSGRSWSRRRGCARPRCRRST